MAIPSLVNAMIQFHTNDDNKDSDTLVTITVRDSNNTAAAFLSANFGEFHDGNDDGPYALRLQNPCTIESLMRGTVEIVIDPNGHDTWRFDFSLDMEFDDGSHLSGKFTNLVLSQNKQQYRAGLGAFNRT